MVGTIPRLGIVVKLNITNKYEVNITKRFELQNSAELVNYFKRNFLIINFMDESATASAK